MKKVLMLFLFVTHFAAAQQVIIPRDTSFTVHSAYVKEKKKRPYIQIVNPSLASGVIKKENITYSKVGNRELKADVFYPAKKRRKGYPGVLLLHGGGWRSGDKSQSWAMAGALAAKGYVAVAVEYRLSLEAPYPAAVHDVKAAVRWLKANTKEYNLTKNKIAVLGVSAGGQLAALVGTTNNLNKLEGTGGNAKQSSAVRAIIDIDGILAFKHLESAEGEVAGQWLGGNYEQKPEIWAEASPLTHSGKNTPPILFINSSNPRFHAGRDDMIKILSKHKVYSEVHELRDTPHPFWLFHPWFDKTVSLTVGFLDKVFKMNR